MGLDVVVAGKRWGCVAEEYHRQRVVLEAVLVAQHVMNVLEMGSRVRRVAKMSLVADSHAECDALVRVGEGKKSLDTPCVIFARGRLLSVMMLEDRQVNVPAVPCWVAQVGPKMVRKDVLDHGDVAHHPIEWIRARPQVIFLHV